MISNVTYKVGCTVVLVLRYLNQKTEVANVCVKLSYKHLPFWEFYNEKSLPFKPPSNNGFLKSKCL